VGYCSYTESRLTFIAFSDNPWPRSHENVMDWLCLDCVADAVADVASGRERERRREEARKRREVA
jgi:hypothetical protein